MKKALSFGLAISAAICIPALSAVKTGNRAPDFSAPAFLAGKEFNFSLRAAPKKSPVASQWLLRELGQLHQSEECAKIVQGNPTRPPDSGV